jgi:ubiquinone/menaquinone biosynthesis C-methylase UbiE
VEVIIVKTPAYLDRLAIYGVDGAHPGGLHLTAKLLRNETITADTLLLDVGCGTGQTSAYIGSHYPCKPVAVDISPEMLEKAEKKFAQYHLDIPLIRADVMNLPFRRNCFDIVLSESVTNFTRIRRTLREYYRVLKPGGILLEIEATALAPLTSKEAETVATLGIQYLPTRDEWRILFQESGFSEIRVLTVQPMSRLGVLPPEFTRCFPDYTGIMGRYRRKMGYGVYRCQK